VDEFGNGHIYGMTVIIMTTFIRHTRMSDNTKPRQTREKTDKYIQIKIEIYT